MVEDAHQVVVLVSSSSDLLSLIHCSPLLSVAPLYPARTLAQGVRNMSLAAARRRDLLMRAGSFLSEAGRRGRRCVTSTIGETIQSAHVFLWHGSTQLRRMSRQTRSA